MERPVSITQGWGFSYCRNRISAPTSADFLQAWGPSKLIKHDGPTDSWAGFTIPDSRGVALSSSSSFQFHWSYQLVTTSSHCHFRMGLSPKRSKNTAKEITQFAACTAKGRTALAALSGTDRRHGAATVTAAFSRAFHELLLPSLADCVSGAPPKIRDRWCRSDS
jgi:hypothetical protein